MNDRSMTMETEQKIVVEPGEGASVSLGGVGVDFKIPAAMTGGAFAIVEHPLDSGRLIPPHIHYREDELSYVLSGEIGVRIADRLHRRPRQLRVQAARHPAHVLERRARAGAPAGGDLAGRLRGVLRRAGRAGGDVPAGGARGAPGGARAGL